MGVAVGPGVEVGQTEPGQEVGVGQGVDVWRGMRVGNGILDAETAPVVGVLVGNIAVAVGVLGCGAGSPPQATTTIATQSPMNPKPPSSDE